MCDSMAADYFVAELHNHLREQFCTALHSLDESEELTLVALYWCYYAGPELLNPFMRGLKKWRQNGHSPRPVS